MKIEKFNIASLSVPALFEATARVLGVVVVLAGVFLASHWLTELTAPRPVARLADTTQAAPDGGGKSITRLFSAGAVQTQAIDGLTLTGVFAGAQGGGFATFRTPKGALSVFPGEEIVAGIRLKQVQKDRVILLSAEATQEIRLNSDTGGAGAAAPIPAGAPTIPAAAAPMPAPTLLSAARPSSAGPIWAWR